MKSISYPKHVHPEAPVFPSIRTEDCSHWSHGWFLAVSSHSQCSKAQSFSLPLCYYQWANKNGDMKISLSCLRLTLPRSLSLHLCFPHFAVKCNVPWHSLREPSPPEQYPLLEDEFSSSHLLLFVLVPTSMVHTPLYHLMPTTSFWVSQGLTPDLADVILPKRLQKPHMCLVFFVRAPARLCASSHNVYSFLHSRALSLLLVFPHWGRASWRRTHHLRNRCLWISWGLGDLPRRESCALGLNTLCFSTG